MKIAFLNYFQQINHRGAETFVDELATRLSTDHQTKIFSAPTATKVAPAIHHLDPLRRFYLDTLSRQIGRWTISQLSALNDFSPDIVIALNGGWQTKILRYWTWSRGKQLVIVGQSGPGWDDRWNLFARPDLFVCLTRRQLRWAKSVFHWPGQRYALIPNGVDLDQFTPTGARASINLQKPIILCVAASEPSKRIAATIRAVARLKQGSLLLLGQGQLDEQINSLGEQLLGTERFLHRSVTHDQMPAYYRAADLFTLCSVSSEAFGIVYIEALATNLPVVATQDASRREIVGTAGLYVSDPENVRLYATKIEAALSRKWKNTPRTQAEKFSWETIASAYEKTLASL